MIQRIQHPSQLHRYVWIGHSFQIRAFAIPPNIKLIIRDCHKKIHKQQVYFLDFLRMTHFVQTSSSFKRFKK